VKRPAGQHDSALNLQKVTYPRFESTEGAAIHWVCRLPPQPCLTARLESTFRGIPARMASARCNLHRISLIIFFQCSRLTLPPQKTLSQTIFLKT
jgi:hypothetical protein